MSRRSVILAGNLAALAPIVLLVYLLFFYPDDISAGQTENRIIFGATYMTMNNPYYQVMDTQLRAGIEEHGDVLLTRDAAMNQNRQNDEIRELIDAGAQAIFLTPVEWDTSEENYFRDYTFYNGHTYKYCNTSKTLIEAQDYSEQLGGYLATITGAEEHNVLRKLLSHYGMTTQHVRTGGYRQGGVGAWTWLNGEEYSYEDWVQGEVNTDSLILYAGDNFKFGMNMSTTALPFLVEWDCDFRESSVGVSSGDIMNFSDALKLSITKNGKLALTSPIWNIDKTSEATLEADTWHHILLRLSDRTSSVYLDGTLTFSTTVSGVSITPENLMLGGYIGYMDEFVFRNGAGTEAPVVPTSAYEMETGTSSTPTANTAPVTRAVWSCSNLPEGLTLSSSGVLSGHPTTAGTYNCNVQVATNWGTATKAIKITVSE